jgi:hypothetical protein
MEIQSRSKRGIPRRSGVSLFLCQRSQADKDRRGAMGLGMSLQDFLNRKALLMRQVEEIRRESHGR